MRRTRGWTRLRTPLLALGLAAAVAGGARGGTMTSAVLAYDTSGSTIGTTGVTYSGTAPTPSSPPITFSTLAGGTFLSPSSLSLGLFQASALAAGQSVTFADTPFDIKFKVDGVNGSTKFLPNDTPIDIKGVLNGTLSGANQSSVTATFSQPTHPAGYTGDPAAYHFATDLYTNTLKLTANPLTIVPSTTNNGQTSAQAVLTTEFSVTNPVPEPSTIVMFAATVAGLGLRHRLRRARAA